MTQSNSFSVVEESDLGQVTPGGVAANSAVPSEIPAPPNTLSSKEKKIWDVITKALLDYGLVHRTDALLLSIICSTYVQWLNAKDELDRFTKKNNGSYIVTTVNGYQQPHQLYYVAGNLKKELLRWLPEAALTVVSFHSILKDRDAPEQGSLFDDPVKQHQQRKVALALRSVKPAGEQS